MGEPIRPESLGQYIRRVRRDRGLSGVQLAGLVGVHPSNISRIESGETATPTPDLLRRIAAALDLDLAELLAYLGLTVPLTTPPLHIYLRTIYPALPDEALQEAEEALARIAERYEVDR
ncbi:helix-turn-helix domain-containing protein [Frankia sp. BMG5.23]|uniref:helix-turn-helix domain-containing protein n=1 Tax=Frankia sp. BMG5.23 TaxID=683305 RepID=UPI000460E182|nr:helix-turn-helix transcriptional regulator [Frankia sp. BMG5.23]KDA44509.1 putative transcriptional regulator [Frankia sp. BMG5.23]